MPGARFSLETLDYTAFGAYTLALCFLGFWMGRRRRATSDEYFLAGRTLPWYVVGSSFVASNISTEHFIGMIGGAFIYGICVATYEWLNVGSFTLLIWIFIPFLLAARVFTIPEFLEKRFSPTLRQLFAVVGDPDDALHDFVGTFSAKRANEPRVLFTYSVGCTGKVERNDRNAERQKPRAKLHGLAGSDDPLGSGDDQRAAPTRRAEDLVDQVTGIRRKLPPPEDLEDRAQSECFECRWPH